MPADMQLFVTRIERDDKLIEEYEAEVIKFLDEVDAIIEQLNNWKKNG
jgi:hypothetical protein